MSNLIDNHVPDFLLSPRFKFVRHFLLLLILACITISIFANQSGELVLTWERFLRVDILFSDHVRNNLFQSLCVSTLFLDKGTIIEVFGICVVSDPVCTFSHCHIAV